MASSVLPSSVDFVDRHLARGGPGWIRRVHERSRTSSLGADDRLGWGGRACARAEARERACAKGSPCGTGGGQNTCRARFRRALWLYFMEVWAEQPFLEH